MTASYETLQVEIAEHVATVTLDRPERLNSFNEQMVTELDALWASVREDDDVRAVVLRAAGDRAFCTGLDVHEGAWWTHLSAWAQQDPGRFIGPKQQGVYKPVIAAVHGMAAGGAMYFLNEADIIVCSDDAVFFDPHANSGIVSSLEPVGMLQRGVPLGDVLRWALLGSDERITAETALRLGLVTEVVERDSLWARAEALAAEIATRDPLAIQGSVRAIWDAINQPPSVTQQTGLLYTMIGNAGDGPAMQPKKQKPRFR